MLYLLMTIPAGFLAWNITEPESFIGAIGFLIVWGILDYVFGFLITIFVAMFSSLIK